MSSRYGGFARAARSAFRTAGRQGSTFRSSSSSNARHYNRVFATNQGTNTRRRWAQTLVPLHHAVANATLVSHLSTSSRNFSVLSPDSFCNIKRILITVSPTPVWAASWQDSAMFLSSVARRSLRCVASAEGIATFRSSNVY